MDESGPSLSKNSAADQSGRQFSQQEFCAARSMSDRCTSARFSLAIVPPPRAMTGGVMTLWLEVGASGIRRRASADPPQWGGNLTPFGALRPKKNLHPNLGPTWVQNRPNSGQNEGLADTRKQDESTT